MISVAMGELGCRSLEEAYLMTWAEFRIRLHAWERQEKRELYRLRELAWVIYNAPYQDPKKMKKNIDSFWSIEPKKGSEVTEKMRQRMKEAVEKYQDEIKQKQNV